MLRKGLWIFFLLTLSLPARGQVGPREDLQGALGEVKQILEKQNPKEELSATLGKYIDFREMGLRALGKYRPAYEKRESEFVPLFIKFLSRIFLDEIIANKDFQVVYLDETFDSGNDRAEVLTRVFLKHGKEEYRVSFAMNRQEGRWRIYDVSAEGVSVLSFYSSQFQRVIRNSSFDELLRRLAGKTGVN